MLVKLEFKDLLMSDGFRERKSKLVDEKSQLHQIVTELRTENSKSVAQMPYLSRSSSSCGMEEKKYVGRGHETESTIAAGKVR